LLASTRAQAYVRDPWGARTNRRRNTRRERSAWDELYCVAGAEDRVRGSAVSSAALITFWPDMSATFTHLVARYGYPFIALGLFVESAGLPVPGETALVTAAALAG